MKYNKFFNTKFEICAISAPSKTFVFVELIFVVFERCAISAPSKTFVGFFIFICLFERCAISAPSKTKTISDNFTLFMSLLTKKNTQQLMVRMSTTNVPLCLTTNLAAKLLAGTQYKVMHLYELMTKN